MALNSQVTELQSGTYSHFSFLMVANTPTGRNSIAFEDNLLSKHNLKITEIKLLIKVQ